jgi:hypothetical protein
MKVLLYTVFNDQEDVTLGLPIAVSKNARIARGFIPSKLSSASSAALLRRARVDRQLSLLLVSISRKIVADNSIARDNANDVECVVAVSLNLPSLFGPADP